MKTTEKLVLPLLEYAYCERDTPDAPQRNWCACLAEAAHAIMESRGVNAVTILRGSRTMSIEEVKNLVDKLRNPVVGDNE